MQLVILFRMPQSLNFRVRGEVVGSRSRAGRVAPRGVFPVLYAGHTIPPLLALLALPAALAQPSLSCGSAPCFAQVFGSNGVLQRAPERAAFFGSGGDQTAPGAALSVELAGTLADGSIFNKSYSTSVRADGTWKALLDPMPAGGLFSARLSCAECSPAPDSNDPLLNLTFGDVFHCGGQSNMNLMTVHSFVRNETYWAMSEGRYDNLRTITFLGCGPTNESTNFVCGRRQPASQGCAPNGDLANWCAPRFMVVNGTGDSGYGPGMQNQMDRFAATCIYFGVALTDLFRARGEEPPPIGLIDTSQGGTMVENWTPWDIQTSNVCANWTCACSWARTTSEPRPPPAALPKLTLPNPNLSWHHRPRPAR